MKHKKHNLMEILSLLMEECDIDDTHLSKATGIPASTISRMRIIKDSNPTASTLRPIANFFSISISQLLGDAPLPINRLKGSFSPTFYTSSRMPVIDWDSAIQWIQNESNTDDINSWVSTEKILSSKSFAIIVPSDSFGLVFRKGSTIIIEPEKEPDDSDFVLVYDVKNKATLLRKLLIDGNDLFIQPVNPDIKKIVTLDHNYNFIGVVVETRFNTLQHENTQKKSKKPFLLAIKERLIKI